LFKKYYFNSISNTNKLYYCYLGIFRKEFPKWQGWKIIADYKKLGIDIKQINDKDLDILVRNFYLLKYIIEMDSKINTLYSVKTML
jgi:hypothetical protein